MQYDNRKSRFHPSVAVDCVIFGFDFNGLQILLLEREIAPATARRSKRTDFKLPGSLIPKNDPLPVAAARVLKELTGLEDVYLKQFHAFGSPDRLKKKFDHDWVEATYRVNIQRVVTIAYYSLVKIDESRLNEYPLKEKAIWLPVSQITKLAMDHMDILTKGLEVLRSELRDDPRVGFALLPKKFSLRQLQTVYEVILGIRLDNRNFRKKIATARYIVPLAEKQKNVAHKPARLYTFSKKLFLKYRKQTLGFAI